MLCCVLVLLSLRSSKKPTKMTAFSPPMAYLMLFFCFLVQSLDLGAAVNGEGRALLRFRERVEDDPYGALLNWDEDDIDPCCWFGVVCSFDGKVVALNLGDLCLKGTLPPELGNLANMKYIVLHNNSLTGIIPREIGNLQKLEMLDLGHNNLSGPLPSELNMISSLEILILRNNNYLANIPPKLQELSMFSDLQIDDNFLSIDAGVSAMKIGNRSLRRLKQVPNKNRRKHHKNGKNRTRAVVSSSPSPSPSSLPLKPQAQSPPKAPAMSPSDPLEISPSPSPAPASPVSTFASSPSVTMKPNSRDPPSSSFVLIPSPAKYPSAKIRKDPEKQHVASWHIYVSVVGAVAFLLATSSVYVFCCRTNKVVTVRPWATGLSGQLQKAFVTGVPSLKRSEIENACEDFSNIIGSLLDCMLYKGTLSSGVEIAVISSSITSAKDWSRHHENQFRKKISALSKVNHKNFVNLLGYCEENEPFTRMMVFEYAPNGTLYEHLHIKEAEHLNWEARLRIAMGIAYCLDHMHRLNPPVIFKNLDSSSIYLTDDYAAKVSDIRFWNEVKESASGPLEAQPSDMEDIVYKFGIILLELISGRLPFSEDYGLLVLWASSYLTGKRLLKEMIDPTLESCHEEDVNALCDVIRLCINQDPKCRPTMAVIASKLREITAMPPDGAVPRLSPLWWAELEILSTEAS